MMKRAVQYKDCHIGDVFKMSPNSPWLHRAYDNEEPIETSDTLRAQVILIDNSDSTIRIRVYVNKEREPRVTGWLYSHVSDSDLLIKNNLEFLPKRKNNYW